MPHYSVEIKKVIREEQLEIPEIAIREILMNAIVHRNYYLRAPTKIAIYDDRVEIFSPGSFPTPLPNLHLGLTDARNMTICRVFRDANLIEKLGSGSITVYEKYKEWGLPEPTIIDGANFVKCILPRKGKSSTILPDDFQKIMNIFESVEELSVSDIINLLHMPRSTATRKLFELVQKGQLLKIGAGKSTRYRRK